MASGSEKSKLGPDIATKLLGKSERRIVSDGGTTDKCNLTWSEAAPLGVKHSFTSGKQTKMAVQGVHVEICSIRSV